MQKADTCYFPSSTFPLLRSAIYFCLLPSAFCFLPSAFCLLPSAFCLLLSAFCLLLSAFCLLLSAFCLLPLLSAFCLLPSAFCAPRVTSARILLCRPRSDLIVVIANEILNLLRRSDVLNDDELSAPGGDHRHHRFPFFRADAHRSPPQKNGSDSCELQESKERCLAAQTRICSHPSSCWLESVAQDPQLTRLVSLQQRFRAPARCSTRGCL